MNFYSDDTYGERVAGVYDEWYSEYEPSAIDMLAELARLNGAARRPKAARALEQLEARTIYIAKHEAHFRV